MGQVSCTFSSCRPKWSELSWSGYYSSTMQGVSTLQTAHAATLPAVHTHNPSMRLGNSWEGAQPLA